MIVEILLGKPKNGGKKKNSEPNRLVLNFNFHPMKSRHFPIFIPYYIDNPAFTLELNMVSQFFHWVNLLAIG